MKPSKYLERFIEAHLSLAEGIILVEPLTVTEEVTTKGGFALPPADVSEKQVNGLAPEKRLLVAHVLVGGQGGEDWAGRVVAINYSAIRTFSLFGDLQAYTPNSIGWISEDSVLMAWDNPASYLKAFKVLNGK